MNSTPKILLIDNASDRKERIRALSQRGFAVFPALKMEEARSRCTRGGYDLIVVHAEGDSQQALEFCDQLRSQCPKQSLLMSSKISVERDYAIAGDLQSLVEGAERILRKEARGTDMASAA
jgi:DNA-binding response OmpR family regulator